MSKKAIILCIIALSLMFASVVAGVALLYSDGGGKVAGNQSVPTYQTDAYPLIPAVPSDAVMVLPFSKLKTCTSLAADSTSLFREIITDSGRSGFLRFMTTLDTAIPKEFRNAGVVVSSHYSGSLTPLMIVAAPADTTEGIRAITSLASVNKLHSEYITCKGIVPSGSSLEKASLLLVSPSEALLSSAKRHLESGSSVMDRDGFAKALSLAGGTDAVFVSGSSSSRILSSYFTRGFSRYAGFFSRYSDWLTFTIDYASGKYTELRVFPSGEEASALFEGRPAGDTRITEAAPASTVFFVSMPVSSAYPKDRKQAVTAQSGKRTTPAQWAERLDIKEVAALSIPTKGGKAADIVAVRVGKEDPILLSDTGISSMKAYKGEILPFAFSGYVSAAFGNLFRADDESSFRYYGGWLYIGGEAVLKTIPDGGRTLDNLLAEAGLGKSVPRLTNIWAYFCPSQSPEILDEVFRGSAKTSYQNLLNGVNFAPVIFTLHGTKGMMEFFRKNVDVQEEEEEIRVQKDTVVDVPAGPWTVTNSATKKKNTFSQAQNNSLTLKDEKGKALWSIPFKHRLCGYVAEVDYYANGKIQFLFAADSKLWLVDRLGRIVKDFPAGLKKPVVLGPAVYDFTGAHGYSAMVVHTDNTVGLYNLHGDDREGWKGIRTEDTIKALPELITVKGKKYWVVRTSVQTLIYGFNGGDSAVKGEKGRMILPDSKILINDKGTVTATCRDGKQRTFKL